MSSFSPLGQFMFSLCKSSLGESAESSQISIVRDDARSFSAAGGSSRSIGDRGEASAGNADSMYSGGGGSRGNDGGIIRLFASTRSSSDSSLDDAFIATRDAECVDENDDADRHNIRQVEGNDGDSDNDDGRCGSGLAASDATAAMPSTAFKNSHRNSSNEDVTLANAMLCNARRRNQQLAQSGTFVAAMDVPPPPPPHIAASPSVGDGSSFENPAGKQRRRNHGLSSSSSS